MNVKLSRAQELHLIAVGLDTLLNNIGVSTVVKKKAHRVPWNKGQKISKSLKRSWTPERRAKFKATMAKKYGKATK